MSTSKTQAKAALETLKNFAMESAKNSVKTAKDKTTDFYKDLKDKHEINGKSFDDYKKAVVESDLFNKVKDTTGKLTDKVAKKFAEVNKPLQFKIGAPKTIDLSKFDSAAISDVGKFNSQIFVLLKEDDKLNPVVILKVMDQFYVTEDDWTVTVLLSEFEEQSRGFDPENLETIENILKDSTIMNFSSAIALPEIEVKSNDSTVKQEAEDEEEKDEKPEVLAEDGVITFDGEELSEDDMKALTKFLADLKNDNEGE